MKMETKFGTKKSTCLQLYSTVQGFNKIWHKFWAFCMNGSERNEAKRHFVLKKVLFYVLISSTAHFELILNENEQQTIIVQDNGHFNTSLLFWGLPLE
jgi:hypothetical protein